MKRSHYFQGEVLERHLDFWKEKLSGLMPILDLPADRPRPSVVSGKGAMQISRLSPVLSRDLNEFSKRNGATLFMTMLAVFKTLLYRYTGVGDLCVGTGIANRRYKEMEGMPGMVINPLPLRTQVAGDITFLQCLHRVKETYLEAFQHEDTPLSKIVEVVQPERHSIDTPIFQVLFSFVDTPTEDLRWPKLKFQLEKIHNGSSGFGINVVVVPPQEHSLDKDNEVGAGTGETLVEWEYNTDIFDAPSIIRMIAHYTRLLKAILHTPEETLSELPMLSDVENHQLLYTFNENASEYPKDKTIHQLFEEQAERTGHKIALVGSSHLVGANGRFIDTTSAIDYMSITYHKLNEKSNQLAWILREKGVKPDTIVGIMVDRSVEMIIGILGILKAGGAYMPIDPDYPQKRINYMLADSKANFLVSKVSKVWGGREVIDLNQLTDSTTLSLPNTPSHPLTDSPTQPSSSNLAYVIYTSGTTGKPKGNLTTHFNAVRVVKNTNYIELKEDDRILQLSNYAFDGSIFDIYGALLNGAALILMGKEDVVSIDKLSNLIKRENITLFFVTTALFNTLVDLEIECLKNVRKILFGGERVSVEHSRKALEYLGKDKIIHVYGPTETTVYATYYFIDQIEEHSGTIPIGKPISNTSVYVMDKNQKPVPMGVIGELYIGGYGVAQGYLNNPELTAEKFVQDFLDYPDDRDKKEKGKGIDKTPSTSLPLYPSTPLYRTGDLVRWLPDGSANIEFIDRIDTQVKLRGFRVELGEIESRLLEIEGIKDVVVLAKEESSKEKYLCAYIVSDHKKSVSELREYLSQTLPDYMIPSFFVPIDKIPLTTNGKIDRKSLPEFGSLDIDTDRAGKYIAPRDAIEKELAVIWAEVLNIERKDALNASIGIDDNFFDLGGHSLKAAVLVSRIHKALNVKVPVKEFFERGCIRGLARYIKEAVEDTFIFIEPTEEKEYYPLSPAQRRLYILYLAAPESTVYNIPVLFELEKAPDIKRLEHAIKTLIALHESLRTSFHMANEEPVQKIHKKVDFKIEYDEIFNSLTSDRQGLPIISPLIRPFDLSQAPLLRAAVIETEGGRCWLMVDMHHIISDGISLSVFIKGLMRLYEGESLPELQLQYRDYSQWQSRQLDSGELEAQENYWVQEFKGEIPSLNMPLDYPRPPVQSFEGDTVTFDIGRELTRHLQILSSKTGATLYMVLLAAYALLLFKYTESETIVIGSPVAGRSHADLDNIIGMFVNTIAIKIHLDYEKSFKEILMRAKEKSMEAYKNQDYPFDMLVDKLNYKRDAGRNPLFDTLFVLQNLEIKRIKIKNLKTIPYEYKSKTSPFDFWMEGVEREDGLDFSIGYCTKIFNRETMERLSRHFIHILNQITGNLDVLVSEIELVSEHEKNQILSRINTTREGEEYDLI